MKKSNLRILRKEEYDYWDEFVFKSENGSVFNSSFFLECFSQNFKILGYFRKNKLIAGTGFFIKKKFGIPYVSVFPLIPYSGVVFQKSSKRYSNDLSEKKKIIRDIGGYFKKYYYSYLRFAPGFDDIQGFLLENYKPEIKYTYILEMDSLGKIWKNFDTNRKGDIRSAEKNKIRIEITEDFSRLFRLVEKTFKRKNKKIKYRKYAFSINRVLSEKRLCRSFIAVDEKGRDVAGVYIVFDNSKAYFLLSGYDEGYNQRGAESLALWEAIKFCKKQGLKEFDFEGSMIPGVEKFLRKFGGKLTPVYCVYFFNKYLEIFYYLYKFFRKSGK
jgi:lipid II:glycine glycyltransferase (peptidoglycan interpeptide bridge formation enzyme)